MKNIYNWPLWHWHFEVTSACTLKCPRCSRTELPEQLVIDSLDLDFFKSNFPEQIVSQMKRVSFCGYDGDPIYNKQFIEICQHFKFNNPEIEMYIVTNGSYKSTEWWTNLAQVLNHKDQIHFSLDGWDQNSNEKYRVNSNWSSIVDGIQALQNYPVRLVWDMIYFDFNYQYQEKIFKLAKQYNFDAIRITKSNKFNFYYDTYEKDLQPPEEFISSSGRFESETVELSDRKIYNDSYAEALEIYNRMDKNKDIIPLCQIGTKGLFVDSQGYFYPCCWIINKYNTEHYQKWLTPDKNIKTSGLETVLNNPYWSYFIESIPGIDICQRKCNSQEVNTDTIGRW
jgi:MoaA/NifB/PqqE/SkfB family radical SAM enzyme